jgi:RimJ/RimL family protein N-acetyltransferase
MNNKMLGAQKLLLKNGSLGVCREAEVKDAENIIGVVNSVGAEKTYILTKKFNHDVEWERNFIRERVKDKRDVLLVVAEVEGNIVGVSDITIGNSPKNRHVGGVGISIMKEWRGLGIGTAMMNYMIDWAKGRRLENLSLEVFSTNRQAIRLYEKFDFQVEGRRRKQYKIEKNYVDGIIMSRFIT